MKIKKSIFRFVPHRARSIFDVQVQINLQGKNLISPLKGGKALDGFWFPSWKTDAIKRMCGAYPGTFVDIGANVGQTLLDHYFADSDTAYVGFEPNPRCVAYLNDIIEANSLERYTILPIGLANETKIVPLYTRQGHDADDAGSLVEGLRPQWELASQYVSCHRFDDVRQTLNLERISFMKIDVEGFELEVLKGMRQTFSDARPVVVCEILFTDTHADLSVNAARNEGIMKLMNELNYAVFQLIKSPDDQRIVDAIRIEQFSNEILTEKNFHLFDYLFVPSEEPGVLKTLLDN